MKKKDTLVTLFKDSILNEGLTPKVKGGRTEVTTISRDGPRSIYNGEGGYTSYDDPACTDDDVYDTF